MFFTFFDKKAKNIIIPAQNQENKRFSYTESYELAHVSSTNFLAHLLDSTKSSAVGF